MMILVMCNVPTRCTAKFQMDPVWTLDEVDLLFMWDPSSLRLHELGDFIMHTNQHSVAHCNMPMQVLQLLINTVQNCKALELLSFELLVKTFFKICMVLGQLSVSET